MFNKIGYSFLFWIITLPGCLTSNKKVMVNDVRKPVVVIHKAIEYAMPGGIRKRSRNNRVFYGHYHPPGKNPKINARRKLIRAHAVIKILGDRRPYAIEIQYLIEKYKEGDYEVSKNDAGLADGVKKKLEDYLGSRPDNRDLIDDFRAF